MREPLSTCLEGNLTNTHVQGLEMSPTAPWAVSLRCRGRGRGRTLSPVASAVPGTEKSLGAQRRDRVAVSCLGNAIRGAQMRLSSQWTANKVPVQVCPECRVFITDPVCLATLYGRRDLTTALRLPCGHLGGRKAPTPPSTTPPSPWPEGREPFVHSPLLSEAEPFRKQQLLNMHHAGGLGSAPPSGGPSPPQPRGLPLPFSVLPPMKGLSGLGGAPSHCSGGADAQPNPEGASRGLPVGASEGYTPLRLPHPLIGPRSPKLTTFEWQGGPARVTRWTA